MMSALVEDVKAATNADLFIKKHNDLARKYDPDDKESIANTFDKFHNL